MTVFAKLNAEQIARARRIQQTSGSMPHRVRATAVLTRDAERKAGRAGEVRRLLARQEYEARSRAKREAFARRTWDHPSGLRVSRSGRLTTPNSRTLTAEDQRSVRRPYGRGVMIGKAAEFGVRERKTRPGRAAEFATGAAATAWGAPRLKMAGPAIARGAKLAEAHGGAEAARATVLAADTARAALIAGTAPLEQVRRLRRVNHLVETVPASLRPAVATVAGAILAAHAIPVRRDQFTPIDGG